MPSSLASPFRGRAWVCRDEGLPSDSPLDLISDKSNRWNGEGEPTLYLSGDPALALVECARHPDDLKDRSCVLQVDVKIPMAVDLRDREVRSSMSLPDDLTWVLDRDRTQAVAASLRRSRMCDALVVPSAGALDQDDRYNLVIFAGDRDLVSRMVAALRPVGELQLSVAAP